MSLTMQASTLPLTTYSFKSGHGDAMQHARVLIETVKALVPRSMPAGVEYVPAERCVALASQALQLVALIDDCDITSIAVNAAAVKQLQAAHTYLWRCLALYTDVLGMNREQAVAELSGGCNYFEYEWPAWTQISE
jgi:hypothetical protein